MFKFFKWFFGILILLTALLGGFIYFTNWYPAGNQSEKVNKEGKSPRLKINQKIKVLSWNVQYMAGKDFVFFYDDGADVAKNVATRPTKVAIRQTLKEVAKVIIEENPDIILLQEVDEGAARTDYQDQLEELLLLLPDEYKNYTSAFYWKSLFVPDPNVAGSAGMKLSILSKYEIKSSTRHSLPLIEYDNLPFNRVVYEWIKRQFYIKRAIQEVAFPVEGGEDFIVFNTHFSAFAQGSNTMQKQVAKAKQLLDNAQAKGNYWIFGGDLNLLPPGKSFEKLSATHQGLYQEKSEIEVLFKDYPVFPSQAQADSSNAKMFYTHFPNDPRVTTPDRIIDYIFYSPNISPSQAFVKQENTLRISDHLPVVMEFELKKK
jgi:endonuclease/exonuclease/phosphatase family metal-dependent hydrolase